jgi:hypothetical protein
MGVIARRLVTVRIATARPFQDAAAAAKREFRVQSHNSVVAQPSPYVEMRALS